MPLARQLIGFCLGLLGIVVAAELCLQLLPVSTATMRDYHRDPDLLTYPPHHRWRVSTGWDLRNPQILQSNNWGFAAERDFVPDPGAIALVGDSYVEASMLAAADRPAAQLEALLGGRRPVYAFGSPGTALLDHAQRIRLASQHLRVRDVVMLLERFDARQSLCGSGNIHSQCLDPRSLQRRIERQPAPGLLKRIVRHSALAQYLGGQIKLRPDALLSAMFTRTTPEDTKASKVMQGARSGPAPMEIDRMQRMVDAVVDAFYADARPYLSVRLIVVVDGRRTGPPEVPELIDLERARLIKRLREHGAIVHDLEPVFADHARRSMRRLEVGPYDGHLNRLGVQLAMKEAAASLAP